MYVLLGQIQAANSEQIRLQTLQLQVTSKMQDELQDLPYRLAAILATRATPEHLSYLDRLGLSGRHIVIIVTAVLTGAMGLVEGRSIREAVLTGLTSAIGGSVGR